MWDERATKALQKQGFTIGGTLGGENGLVPRRCLDRNGRHVVIRICKRGDDAEIKARRLLPVSHHGIEDVIEIRQAGPEKVAIVSRWVEATTWQSFWLVGAHWSRGSWLHYWIRQPQPWLFT